MSAFIANQFLEKAGPDGLSPMKLLKLAYLAQGWMLGLYGVPIISEDVEAWKYGPVYRDIYRSVAGKTTVTTPLPTFLSRAPLNNQESHLIDQIWDRYGSMTGLQLSSLTHQPGSPWDITYRTRGQNSVIPQALMREYYGAQARARA